MRIAAKRCSTVSCPGSEPDLDPCSLESALHSFLSTVPEGLTRCRKTRLPPVEGSPSELGSKPVERAEVTACTRQGRPEKKHLKLQREDEQLEDREAEKMREITRKVLRYQNSKSSLDGGKVSGSPCRSDRAQDTPATPNTPKPRTRDYFFAHNGDVGSPWTILSPLACSQRNPLRNKQLHQHRLSSGGNDLDEGVWESEEGNHLSTSSDQEPLTSPSGGSLSFPECPNQGAVAKGPLLRSVSMDETRPSPASRFRLGDFLHRSISQRSYSSGSRTENLRENRICPIVGSKMENPAEAQVSASGFISFFRRIGGRTKPNSMEEHHFKGSNT